MSETETETGVVTYTLSEASPYPLGASVTETGVQFALYSRQGSRVWLALFDNPEDETPFREFELNPRKHRFGHVWTVVVEGLGAGVIYAYRVDGPYDPKRGLRYDARHYLIDPYAKAVVNNTGEGFPKNLVIDDRRRPVCVCRPPVETADTIIYETHVKGLTAHESAGVEHPGTYGAAAEKAAEYLKALGVTTVELLPVQECGEPSLTLRHPETGKRLTNYWGYNPLALSAPAGRFASCGGQTGGQHEEFRAMVDAFHEQGLEVILDVVYNHTSEGGAGGPMQSFRGIDNPLYYLLDSKGQYVDYSGCGNTVNCAHPVVSDLIVESLRHWVRQMNVDGFRFDLASILNRDKRGHLHQASALVERIGEDPLLHNVKLIAEAWDLGGAYQVGHFGTPRWCDWNGRFRDDMRRYWHGDHAAKTDFALRLTGSPDFYQGAGRPPQNSINFVTAHDGFTLRDLVSYNHKHNEANGENNRDGSNHDLSWNCGVEGETDNAEVNELRLRLQKDFIATLFLSLGTPMLLGGDEFGRTQRGNNNAYCQDNTVSWCDWRLLDEYADLHRFCKKMIAFRKTHPVLRRTRYFTGKPAGGDGAPDLAWFNPWGQALQWENHDPCIACMIHPSQNEGAGLYFMFNPTLSAEPFRIPKGSWRCCINTGLPSPYDFPKTDDAPVVQAHERFVLGRKALAVFASVDFGA